MKSNRQNINDQRLGDLLCEWKVEAPLPPGFRDQVWRRIERPAAVSPNSWEALRRWVERALPRPALAVSYVAVLVAVGAGAGWTQARSENKRMDAALGRRYVQLVDPYLRVAAAER